MLRPKVFLAKYFRLLLQPIGFGPLHGSYTADAVFVLYIHDRGHSAARFSAKVVGHQSITRWNGQRAGLSEKTIAAHSLLTQREGKVSEYSSPPPLFFCVAGQSFAGIWTGGEIPRPQSRHHLHLQLGQICHAG